MNEKLQYATMLEIPVSTCNVTFKTTKKRRGRRKKVDVDQVKNQLVDKVNLQMENENQTTLTEQTARTELETVDVLPTEEISNNIDEQPDNIDTAVVRSVKKKRFKFSIVGVQLVIIGVLVAVIFLTNALYTDSGINVFLRSVFGTQQSEQTDAREYGDFSPVISLNDGTSVFLNDGVVTLSGKGSLYAPCNGKVTMLALGEDGKYTIEITHSEKFKSVLAGIDYAYVGIDDSVYFNIPVGYISAGATMCFTNGDGTIISDYQIIDDAVVWVV